MDRNYEQEYKKAFEAAKGLHDEGNALTKMQMEIVFPQLAESEDERIKKIITDSVFYQYGADKEYEDVLDYLDKLEKQKEQKPIQSDVEREYVRTLKSLISDFLRGKEEVDREYYQQIYDWLDGRHIEQKPAEVDESTKRLNENWMKQHFDDYKEQKPAEWSEEDSEMMMRIINQVGGYTYFAGMDSERVVNWLKSIRPVSKESLQSWKPSEEQMKALLGAEGISRASGYPDNAKVLASLYEQLKKL